MMEETHETKEIQGRKETYLLVSFTSSVPLVF